jgi:hypothetical protein
VLVRVRFQSREGLVFRSRLAPPVTIDAGMLSDEELRSLEQLVQDPRFFDLPSRVPGPRDVPDPTFHITIEDRGRRHSVSVSAPVQGPALRRLIDRLLEESVKSDVRSLK